MIAARQANEIERRVVGVDDVPALVDNKNAVRHGRNHGLDRVASRDRHGIFVPRSPHQQVIAPRLAVRLDNKGRQVLVSADPTLDPIGFAFGCNGRDLGGQCGLFGAREKGGEGETVELAGGSFEQLTRRIVGVHDLLARRVNDQQGLIGEAEQQTVAGLDFTQATNVAVHTDLRAQKAALQIRDRPHVRAQQHEASATNGCGSVRHGQIGGGACRGARIKRWVVDLTSDQDAPPQGAANESIGFGLAFRRYALAEALPDPALGSEGRQGGVRIPDIDHFAIIANGNHDIGGRCHKHRGLDSRQG